MEQIYRLHYRAQLKEEYSIADLQEAAGQCENNIRELQKAGKLLTAALYYADKMLFLYYEAMGEQRAVVEPIKAAESRETDLLLESGEDVQLTAPQPMDFLGALSSYLMPWPGQNKTRLWVHMYHIYYHNIPEGVEDWKRTAIPQMRRGRIAFLREDKLFSYTYYHRAIVEEGLLTGDRYQSIALHENILFSYFEEPKTFSNVRRCEEEESEVIKDWLAVNPEAHFIHMPEGKGENFMFLPAVFALGIEDMQA